MDSEEANKLLEYNPITGNLHWKVSRGNGVKIGDIAGHFHYTGYIKLMCKGERHQAHRIVWLMAYGCFPSSALDHINHNRSDNRLCNLRMATRTQNNRNARLRKDNKTGVPGVNFIKRLGKWRADIRVNTKTIYLGLFMHWFDAVCARKAAQNKYGFHANYGKSHTEINKRISNA